MSKTFVYEEIGGCPYKSYNDLAEQWSISKDTVKSRIKEIEQWIAAGRYPANSLISDGQLVRMNEYVFSDYLCYRTRLRDSAARKKVPAYNPSAWSEAFGNRRRLVEVNSEVFTA
ncbi:MAG: hypothetical protein Q4B85_05540 [Lachnospiraceae bacterium]|nr:hypothetical protein [Lachnospiraceae bacterium]